MHFSSFFMRAFKLRIKLYLKTRFSFAIFTGFDNLTMLEKMNNPNTTIRKFK